MRLQCRSDLPQIVWQPLAEHDPVLIITDDHHRIVRVQVYATIFHVGLRRVKAQLRKLTLTPSLERGEEAGYMIIIRVNERYWQGNVQMSAHLERLTLLRARRGSSLDPLKATA